MRLALQTDYALRTLLFLATRTGRTTVSDVAEFFGISAHHVGKVVHQLGKLGYVRNHRGPSGGIELARSRVRSPSAALCSISRGICTSSIVSPRRLSA